MRNDNLFFAAFSELIERGCPTDLAGEAATVVANDDPTKHDLGRTPQDQSVIQQALPYLQRERKPT
ncbi:hypothetical protein [Anabaena sp. CA = ATCC 33047]|uniref:hypothetical protein n=1 Tax=Anabaena sp. (strain CA / ATCC 33047) TaxID=52271 RepID=UPI00082CDC4C|nr:hypothetical protein [Anabaena sp. CA = ATCC 33047]